MIVGVGALERPDHHDQRRWTPGEALSASWSWVWCRWDDTSVMITKTVVVEGAVSMVLLLPMW